MEEIKAGSTCPLVQLTPLSPTGGPIIIGTGGPVVPDRVSVGWDMWCPIHPGGGGVRLYQLKAKTC